MNFKLFIKITLLHFFLAGLCANDTKITVASGGIVIEEQEPDIEIVSEKLEISTGKIKVVYDFFNHGRTKTILVGFPLPLSPYDMNDSYPYASWDEAQIAYRFLYGDLSNTVESPPIDRTKLSDGLKLATIIDFSVLVNKRKVKFGYHTRAYSPEGKDVTDLLIKHRVPISSAYLRGFLEQPPIDLFPGLENTLKELKMLDSKGRPNWYLKTTYVWQQEFLANKTTHVEHSYTPSRGVYPINVKDFDDSGNIKVNRNSSLDLSKCTFDHQHYNVFLRQWRKRTEENPNRRYKWMYEVRYILKTGANWFNSIRKFHLKIKPKNPNDLIILEGNYPMKRLSNGVCVVDLENFKPAQDLRVCIIPALMQSGWEGRD